MKVEEEATQLLMQAIAKLPARSAEVIKLSLQGMRQEKIAEQMDITIFTVKALKAAIKKS